MKKIKVDVYGQEIMVFKSTDDMQRWIKKNPVHEEECFDEFHHAAGFAGILMMEDGSGRFFMCIQDGDVITVCHEALHLAYQMLHAVGVEHDVENHEALAYLQHYIFGEAAKSLGLMTELSAE